jgi:hypothetical protein
MAVPDPFKPSQAGIDLGMGADLQQQVMSQILERRKRSMLAAQQANAPTTYGALSLGPPQTGVGNTGGMALNVLMSTGGAIGG